MTLRTLIVDDEAPARRRLRRLLLTEPDVAIVGECGDGAAALAAIAATRPDLVLLDVQMPELDGFDVLSRLPAADLPAVLFVTAFDRYALRAFDVHAVDYLLKPFTAERFRTAIGRARARTAEQGADGVAGLAAALRQRRVWLARLPVRAGSRTIFVDVRAIDWLESADNYVRLHVRGREYLARETLASLETQLDPERFVRVHRSAMVQADRIAELCSESHGDATARLADGTKVPVSRTYRDRLQAVLAPRRTP